MARRGRLSYYVLTKYYLRAGPAGVSSDLSQEVGIAGRCTVSSAVSPVGPDLVGSSGAERGRVRCH